MYDYRDFIVQTNSLRRVFFVEFNLKTSSLYKEIFAQTESVNQEFTLSYRDLSKGLCSLCQALVCQMVAYQLGIKTV